MNNFPTANAACRKQIHYSSST